MENFDRLPDYMVFDLLDAFENESEELERIVFDITMFFKEQDSDWQKLEEEQETKAEGIIDGYMTKLNDQELIAEARDKIDEIE